MQSFLWEVGSVSFRPLTGFPLSLESFMSKFSEKSSYYPESSWTWSCSNWSISFTVILRKTTDTTDVRDNQLLSCSHFHPTCCPYQVCSASWFWFEGGASPVEGKSRRVAVWGAISCDIFPCPIECPLVFGGISAYLYIHDPALLLCNFLSLTSCSLNTYYEYFHFVWCTQNM
jgi:hypothetical protein